MFQVITPVACVAAPCFPYEGAIAIHLAIDVLAFVSVTIFVFIGAVSVHLVVIVVSGVLGAT